MRRSTFREFTNLTLPMIYNALNSKSKITDFWKVVDAGLSPWSIDRPACFALASTGEWLTRDCENEEAFFVCEFECNPKTNADGMLVSTDLFDYKLFYRVWGSSVHLKLT